MFKMKVEHIKSEEVKVNDFKIIEVQDFLNRKEYDTFSIAKVKINGEQKFGRDTNSDLAYFVLEGKGKFYIEDNVFEVKKGDLVFIPKNTKYKDEGNLSLLAIAAPRFERSKRVREE